MRFILKFAALAGALLISACASLTAEHPLFTTADQVGPAPLTEGIWIFVNEDCSERNAHRTGRFPYQCVPMEFRRLEDGAWQWRIRRDLMLSVPRDEEHATPEGPLRMLIVPAIEHANPEQYAPLYVAEIAPHEDDGIGYALIAPVGDGMPSTDFVALSSIGCADILADGPIAGVEEHYRDRVQENGETVHELDSCVASTQDAVREAARRALIRNLPALRRDHFVYARPLSD